MAINTSPYAKFDGGNLILRDELAIDRTLLANERTLLAYLRSGVALFIAGVSIINFSEQTWFLAIGFICLPAAIAVSLIGIARYRGMNASIAIVRKQAQPEAKSLPQPGNE